MYNTDILGGNLFKVSKLSKSSSICLEIERPLNSPSSWRVFHLQGHESLMIHISESAFAFP